MLRKLNFTERVRIPRANIRVTLRRDADGTLLFDPRLSFDGIGAAPTTRVFIEAFYRTSFMRFDCGSVAHFAPPADRRLTEIDSTSLVHFRVKLVDEEHRVVAVADDIVVSEQKPESTGRLPLLPVSFTSALGQQAWRIAFEPNGPVLELNNRVDDIQDVARSDAAFLALVYPAAVRQVLTQILLIDAHDAHEAGDEWWNFWLQWAAQYATSPLPDDADEAPYWIDEVVDAFCNRQTLIDGWRAAQRERG